MLAQHEGRSPDVDRGAWVAPTAVLCGDVRVAAGARVLCRGAPATQATGRYADFGRHRDDKVVG
jgi:carbonic anhydrase/acetyltransferase-like protein (isoleucine patch superfamily)